MSDSEIIKEHSDIVYPTLQEAIKATETLLLFCRCRDMSADTLNEVHHVYGMTENLFYGKASSKENVQLLPMLNISIIPYAFFICFLFAVFSFENLNTIYNL